MPSTTWHPLLAAYERGEAFHITDTETTGFKPPGARVIELATVSLRRGEVVDRFETFIDPGVFVPSRITEITGITTPMLRGAPKPPVALKRWLDYMGGTGHFVAHNANFDWNFLKAECDMAGLAWPFGRSFCTVQLARHCLPRLRSHKLEELIAHYGIRVSDRHRALADVEATATVFLNLLSQLGADVAPAPSVERSATWEDVLAYLKGLSPTTAAIVTQQASVRMEEDGLVLALKPNFCARLEQDRERAFLEKAVAHVFGAAYPLRLEAASTTASSV